MEIQTVRLTLDGSRPDDAESLFCYRANPLVSRFQGRCPAFVIAASTFIDGLQAISLDKPGSRFQRAIRLGGDAALISDVGLHFIENADATVEFGISLAPLHQDKSRVWRPKRCALCSRSPSKNWASIV